MSPTQFWSGFGVPHPDRTVDPGRFQAPERDLENFSEVI